MVENEKQAYSIEEIQQSSESSASDRDEALKNSRKGPAMRRPRGLVHYPYSNRHGAQGFTIYRPLSQDEKTTSSEVM